MSDHEYIMKLSVALANLLEVVKAVPTITYLNASCSTGVYHSISVAQAALDQPR